MNVPQKIIVHHSAVSREKNANQFDAIDRYHKSKGWGMIGYHYLIEPSGEVKNGREENVSGAHCSQSLMNYRSIGICLTGHFDLEDPTKEQIKSLYTLIREIQDKYGIEDKNVLPHRHYATYKSCWGNRLPNDIIGYCNAVLSKTGEVSGWAKDAVDWCIKEGIATDWNNPQEVVATNVAELMFYRSGHKNIVDGKGITKEELAVILYRLKDITR